jgi:iron complex transport system ATP-binding protein
VTGGSSDGLRADGVTVAHGARDVLHAVDLHPRPGEVTCLVGPNGSGKSTLLLTLGRVLTPRAGTVLLDGRDVRTVSGRTSARRVALLPQGPTAPDGLRVRELVAQGRHPWTGRLGGPTPTDHAAVDDAMVAAGVADLADRRVGELSGGEHQRAWIALVLAQDTPTLLLDEPTNHLDVAHQLELLRLVRRRADEHGTTCVLVLHDLNLAARFADRLVALRDGVVVAAGRPAEVLTPGLLRTVFDVAAVVVPDPVTGRPMFVPTGDERL